MKTRNVFFDVASGWSRRSLSQGRSFFFRSRLDTWIKLTSTSRPFGVKWGNKGKSVAKKKKIQFRVHVGGHCFWRHLLHFGLSDSWCSTSLPPPPPVLTRLLLNTWWMAASLVVCRVKTTSSFHQRKCSGVCASFFLSQRDGDRAPKKKMYFLFFLFFPPFSWFPFCRLHTTLGFFSSSGLGESAISDLVLCGCCCWACHGWCMRHYFPWRDPSHRGPQHLISLPPHSVSYADEKDPHTHTHTHRLIALSPIAHTPSTLREMDTHSFKVSTNGRFYDRPTLILQHSYSIFSLVSISRPEISSARPIQNSFAICSAAILNLNRSRTRLPPWNHYFFLKKKVQVDQLKRTADMWFLGGVFTEHADRSETRRKLIGPKCLNNRKEVNIFFLLRIFISSFKREI